MSSRASCRATCHSPLGTATPGACVGHSLRAGRRALPPEAAELCGGFRSWLLLIELIWLTKSLANPAIPHFLCATAPLAPRDRPRACRGCASRYAPRTSTHRVHSSVVRAADCRSAGPWLKSGCALRLYAYANAHSDRRPTPMQRAAGRWSRAWWLPHKAAGCLV